KVAVVPTNGVPGSATLTESEEDQGIALKCVIRNAQWAQELEWGITETRDTNGISSLSDVLLLQNEGPDAAVILLSDNSFGTPTPPRPNPLLVASAASLQFHAELLVLDGTNATAQITLLDDDVNSSDTLIVRVIKRIPTNYKVADVPTNGVPGTVAITEAEEGAGIA